VGKSMGEINEHWAPKGYVSYKCYKVVLKVNFCKKWASIGCLETVLAKTLIGMWGIVVASHVCRGSQSKFPGPFNAPHHCAHVTTCPLDFSDDSLLRVMPMSFSKKVEKATNWFVSW